MMLKAILILTLVFICPIFNESHAELGDTLYEFEQKELIKDFKFTERASKTLPTGEDAYLYKSKDGNLLEIILNKEGRVRKQTLITGATISSSNIQLLMPSLISKFVLETSGGQINKQEFDIMLKRVLKEGQIGGRLSRFSVEIIFVKLWGEFEGIGKLTISISKIPDERKIQQDKNRLVCDLNQGVLGNLRVGDFVEQKDIIETIGGKPSVISDELFGRQCKYFDKGIIVVITGTSKIYEIWIYYKDLKELDGYYKRFEGELLPLSGYENMETIRKIFGHPNRESTDMIHGTPEFTYGKSYGELHFCFEKNGELSIIVMRGR